MALSVSKIEHLYVSQSETELKGYENVPEAKLVALNEQPDAIDHPRSE